MKTPIYQKLSRHLSAMENRSRVSAVYQDHSEKIESLIEKHFPRGSGFNGHTWFDFDLSNPEKLILLTEYSWLHENGYYDGWSTVKIIVKPSLAWGFDFKITGVARRHRHDVEYFEEVVNTFLTTGV
jgi:hypothetical protein